VNYIHLYALYTMAINQFPVFYFFLTAMKYWRGFRGNNPVMTNFMNCLYCKAFLCLSIIQNLKDNTVTNYLTFKTSYNIVMILLNLMNINITIYNSRVFFHRYWAMFPMPKLQGENSQFKKQKIIWSKITVIMLHLTALCYRKL
jgi:hypothetical protein